MNELLSRLDFLLDRQLGAPFSLVGFLGSIVSTYQVMYSVHGDIVQVHAVQGRSVNLRLKQTPTGSVMYETGSRWVPVNTEEDLLVLLGVGKLKKSSPEKKPASPRPGGKSPPSASALLRKALTPSPPRSPTARPTLPPRSTSPSLSRLKKKK